MTGPWTIAAVERETGLSKDTLRVWERRYGFPQPQRDASGERLYDAPQLERLRHIRRALDAGHRPGQVVPLPLAELQALGTAPAGPSPKAPARAAVAPPADARAASAFVDAWMDALRRRDLPALHSGMRQALQRLGLDLFVRAVVAPMNQRVGQAWLAGELAVFDEHLYSEAVQNALRLAIAQVGVLREPRPPRVLLGSFPQEPHTLGLLMAEAQLVLHGCQTLALGPRTPVADIAAAALAHRADAVALSCSASQNPRVLQASLRDLRAALPAQVPIWAGGGHPLLRRTLGLRRLGVQPLPTLEDIGPTVSRWRA